MIMPTLRLSPDGRVSPSVEPSEVQEVTGSAFPRQLVDTERDGGFPPGRNDRRLRRKGSPKGKKVLWKGVTVGVGLRAPLSRTKNEKVGLTFTFKGRGKCRIMPMETGLE